MRWRYSILLSSSAVVVVLCLWLGWFIRSKEKTQGGIPESTEFCDVDVLANPVVGDMRFEIVDAACDTLAKDEIVRIYVVSPHRSWFGLVKDRETLLFGYDPGRPDNELPHIGVDATGSLTISIREISSIWYKTDQWNGRRIRYDIGRIDYPS